MRFGLGRRRRSAVPERAALRRLVVELVERNPLVAVSDPAAVEQLRAGADVRFDALGLDSLARLTLAVDLDERGYAISELEVNEAESIDGLTDHLLRLR